MQLTRFKPIFTLLLSGILTASLLAGCSGGGTPR